jgi:hypothetical protein
MFAHIFAVIKRVLQTFWQNMLPKRSPGRGIDALVDSLDLPVLEFKARDDFSEGRSSYHSGILPKL